MAQQEYRHMSAAEFARSLDDWGITLSQFCRIIGEDYELVRDGWLQQQNVPIPHYIRVLFAVCSLPGAREIARQLTDAVVIKSERFVPEKAAYGHGKEAQKSQAPATSVVVERKPSRGPMR